MTTLSAAIQRTYVGMRDGLSPRVLVVGGAVACSGAAMMWPTEAPVSGAAYLPPLALVIIGGVLFWAGGKRIVQGTGKDDTYGD